MSTSMLPSIQNQLNYYGYPICLVLGNIGNLLIITIFNQQRVNACSFYLICAAIASNCYLTFNSLVQIFPFYYSDETVRAFALCKIRFYMSNVFGQVAKTMVVLACIDRFMFVSGRTRFREFSTPKRLVWIIIVTIMFWFTCASHIAIMTTIINKKCGTFFVYNTIYTIYSLIVVGMLPPLILGVFGYLTYYHLRKLHQRVRPTNINNNINGNEEGVIVVRRRDKELLIIVISEVFVYVIATTSYPLVLLEMMISQYVMPQKPLEYAQIENFIFTIAFLLLFFNNMLPFYIYLVVSKPFRRHFQKLIINVYRRFRFQRVMPITSMGHSLSNARRNTHT